MPLNRDFSLPPFLDLSHMFGKPILVPNKQFGPFGFPLAGISNSTKDGGTTFDKAQEGHTRSQYQRGKAVRPSLTGVSGRVWVRRDQN